MLFHFRNNHFRIRGAFTATTTVFTVDTAPGLHEQLKKDRE